MSAKPCVPGRVCNCPREYPRCRVVVERERKAAERDRLARIGTVLHEAAEEMGRS